MGPRRAPWRSPGQSFSYGLRSLARARPLAEVHVDIASTGHRLIDRLVEVDGTGVDQPEPGLDALVVAALALLLVLVRLLLLLVARHCRVGGSHGSEHLIRSQRLRRRGRRRRRWRWRRWRRRRRWWRRRRRRAATRRATVDRRLRRERPRDLHDRSEVFAGDLGAVRFDLPAEDIERRRRRGRRVYRGGRGAGGDGKAAVPDSDSAEIVGSPAVLDEEAAADIGGDATGGHVTVRIVGAVVRRQLPGGDRGWILFQLADDGLIRDPDIVGVERERSGKSARGVGHRDAAVVGDHLDIVARVERQGVRRAGIYIIDR